MSVTVSGSAFVRADRNMVWTALHDVAVISRCLPGCRSLTRVSESAFALALQIRLGPIGIDFDGTVEVCESDPPSRYCLVGRGGASYAGDAVGRATITLREQSGGCCLAYVVEAETRGPVSMAGPRVQVGIGKAIAGMFTSRLSSIVGDDGPESGLQRVLLPDQVSATRRR